MKIFLDANILVSVLNKEYPVFPFSSRIMSLPEFYPRIILYTSPVCLAITAYFAEKKSGRTEAKRKIELLIGRLGISLMNEETTRKAIQNPAIEDFEDGLEYYSALQADCNFIITEDPADFYFSSIPVYRSREFLLHHFQG